MCGVIVMFGQRIEIPCEPVRWRWPWPPIDFNQLYEDFVPGQPDPTPWREDLTSISQILTLAGSLNDRKLANSLGALAAEIGSKIGAEAPIDVAFDWNVDAPRRANAAS
jgi:hypothetical protein